MTHPNEPSLVELRKIRSELYAKESTDENMKKLQAVEQQIKRREHAKQGRD